MAFSKFSCRVLEQMLIYEFKPTLNSLTTVKHDYTTWSSDRLLLEEEKFIGSKPINIGDKGGFILFESNTRD